jgi:wobble nucleotide-excising tRNase
MLVRIVRLNHVGLFRAGIAQALTLRKVTAFYGENGRGKSTLSAVLDSCSSANPALIQRRNTIDEANAAPRVELVFDGGAGGNVQFDGQTWSVARPDMLVFDSQFVHDNVYTGLEVTSANRKGLYEFALGDQAAVLQQLEGLQTQTRDALREKGEREQALRLVSGPYNVADFVALAPDPAIEDALRAARQRVTANRESAQVLARQDLVNLTLPGEFSLGDTVTLLNRTVENLNRRTVAHVREHFQKHAARGLEEWVNRGREFDASEECPYCGQNTEHNDLVAAYGQYFSDEFQQLGGIVLTRLRQALAHLGEPAIDALRNAIAANDARRGAWADLQPSDAIPFDFERVSRDIRSLRETLERLFDEKRANLLAAVVNAVDDFDTNLLMGAITRSLDQYNAEAQRINALFAERRAEVAAGDATALAREVQRLEAVTRRGINNVIENVQGYLDASTEHTSATNQRAALRAQHDAAMATQLAQYQTRINARLAEFRAGFSIEAFGTSYAAGQAPRATFAISLRGRSIRELEHTANGPSFPTALSDGDRRTLALAFFLARLDLDPHLTDKIIVFDDPMASFDRNRKEATVRIVHELAGKCNQVIVLSHDAYFLREIEERVDNRAANFAVHKIGYGNNDDAVMAVCDLAGECTTPYMRNYALVSNYLAGVPNIAARTVASALRILVEEFYKLRYPGDFAPDQTLGTFIAAVRAASLVGIGALADFPADIEALGRFNEFASRFHHSNPNAQNEPLNENDVRHYARGALSLIHDDGASHTV